MMPKSGKKLSACPKWTKFCSEIQQKNLQLLPHTLFQHIFGMSYSGLGNVGSLSNLLTYSSAVLHLDKSPTYA